MVTQQLRERPRVGRRLEGDRVVRAERRRERPELVAHRDAAAAGGPSPALHDRDVGEVATDVEPDKPHRVPPPSIIADTGSGDTTPTDACAEAQPVKSQGRPHRLSDSDVH